MQRDPAGGLVMKCLQLLNIFLTQEQLKGWGLGRVDGKIFTPAGGHGKKATLDALPLRTTRRGIRLWGGMGRNLWGKKKAMDAGRAGLRGLAGLYGQGQGDAHGGALAHG
jgi:hypothetical protein